MARGKKQSTRRVQNVRVTDNYAGEDGLKFDRVLTQLQNSHSQTTLCIQDEFGIDVTSAPQVGKLAQSQFRIFDDFVSMAAQFQTYRIKRVRFDIYDAFPGSGATIFWSTFHDVNTTGAQHVPTLNGVIDGPDSQIVPPGTGKISLFWTAKGVLENEFQSTTSSTPAIQDFGGLRYYAPGSSTPVNGKYQVFCKVIVDFRGRT